MTDNAHLAELTGLPNLDTITNTKRLAILADIADRKSVLPSNEGPRARYFILYAALAIAKAEEE